jgi:antitoxin FitA
MATLTIRNLDEDVKERIRVRAATRGHSMEAEVRDILERAVKTSPAPAKDFGTLTHELFKGLGWDGSTLPSRDEPPRYADFDE